MPRATRALLPDALLQDPWTLLQRIAVLIDQQGMVCGLSAPAAIPSSLRLEVFPGEIWTAAPVMAHAHLESYDAPSASWAGLDFCTWVEKLLAWRALPSRLDGLASAALSCAELARYGCGTVLSHGVEADTSGPDSSALPEVLSLLEIFAPSKKDFTSLPWGHPLAAEGLALHAPYSVAPVVAREIFHRYRASGLVSIHLGEHAEERRYLAEGAGPMADLLTQRGRAVSPQRWGSAVDWLQDMGGMHRGTLAVHGGDLQVEELQSLHKAGVALVFCPGTHLFFARPQPRFLQAKLPLPALGCDSRASNTCLSPLREVALAWQCMPEPGPQAWWEALSCGGAAALQRADLGRIAPEFRARILRVWDVPLSARSQAQELCAFLCSGQEFPVRVCDFFGPISTEVDV